MPDCNRKPPSTPLVYVFYRLFDEPPFAVAKRPRSIRLDNQASARRPPLAVIEEHTDALAVMHASNRLCKHVAHFKHFQLGTTRLVLSLIDRVRDYDLVQCAGVDAIDSIAAQDAVGNERIHLGRALLLQQLRGPSNGIRGICQVVDEDGGALCNVSDQHHGRVLSVVNLRGSTLLVNEGKWHAERIGDGGRTLSTASIGADDDGLLVVGDVELDVFPEEMAAVQVVDRDVEEALVLGV